MVVFIRDEVARPAIGHHDADRFLPYLLTMFFFIVGCNLLGLVPWAGSATGALATTGALALLTFATVIFAGMAKLGPVKFWLAQVPHMDLPEPIGVLAQADDLRHRAGRPVHQALHPGHASFGQHDGRPPGAGRDPGVYRRQLRRAWPWYAVAPASVLGVVALSLLELFVAFLQAYIFTFLSALFIGMAVHPH